MTIDPTYVANVATIANLKAIGSNSSSYGPVYVKGFYQTGDGGQGAFVWDSSSTATPNDGTIVQATGVSTGRWLREFSGPINVCWFGATGDGITNSTAAIQAALNLGKSTYVPDGTFLVTSTLTIKTPYQEFYGAGRGSSQITFANTSSSIGLDIQPSSGIATERVIVRDLYLRGASNITKLINVGGPQTQILHNRLVNSSAGGDVVYLQPENTGTGIFNFGTRIILNEIYGSLAGGTGGGFGIYLGNNNQTTSICFNNIENNNIHIYLNGSTAQLTVDSNVMQRCSDSQQAIYINNDSSTIPCIDVNFTRNYFEQVHNAFVLDKVEITSLVISNNYAYRNTSSAKSTSAFFTTGTNSSSSSRTIWVENNYVEDYNSIFALGGQNAAMQLVSTKGNRAGTGTTNYAIGAYAAYAYTTRQSNPYFTKKVTSGVIVSESTLRIESVTCTYQVPIEWQNHEEADSLKFYYIPVGSAQVVVKLFKLDTSVSIPTQVQIGSTLTVTTEGFQTLTLSGLADPHTQYFVEVSTSGGTTSYTYPFNLYLRQ